MKLEPLNKKRSLVRKVGASFQEAGRAEGGGVQGPDSLGAAEIDEGTAYLCAFIVARESPHVARHLLSKA